MGDYLPSPTTISSLPQSRRQPWPSRWMFSWGRSSLVTRLFQQIQSMQCVAIEQMQAVAHYCDRCHKNLSFSITFLLRPSVLRFALKPAKLTLHKLAKSLNGHKTATR